MTAPTVESSPAVSVAAVLEAGSVRAVFQPIVDLVAGTVVAYEALARGPEGPLAHPMAMFAAARDEGLLGRLDEACRAAAFRGAVDQGLLSPWTVFVNVEPEVLDTSPLDDLLAIAETAPGELWIVLEITERALMARPAELLRTVERVRSLGWGIALDDVGADEASLAFMPLLRPDVIKLDLSIVQRRPDRAVAEIVNAVNAHAERTGALILAEGIETESQVAIARSLGATLGQGWFFGRPEPAPRHDVPECCLRLPEPLPAESGELRSPFDCVPRSRPPRRATKALLIEISKQLEREAIQIGRTSVVASTFQHSEHFTRGTVARYQALVESTALGAGLGGYPLVGLRGADLAPHDPLRNEWDVVVVGPHFSAALLARDLGDTGPDLEREFEYVVTYDRDVVVSAALALLLRVAPRVVDASLR